MLMIITEMNEWRDYWRNHETVVRLSTQDDRDLRVLTADEDQLRGGDDPHQSLCPSFHS